MGLKRYTASADTTITNAFRSNLTKRGTGSNMGRADSLEIFSIYGQESSGSSELSRALLKFPSDAIAADRAAGTIPASGSVNFYLRMFNAVTPFTLPRNFTLQVQAVSGAHSSDTPKQYDFNWQEGSGIDMDNYTDVTRDGDGTNWINMGSSSADGVVKWGSQGSISAGGAFFNDISSSFTQTFDDGTEDLEVDITPLIEQFVNSSGNILGSKTDYGIGVKLTGSQEAFVAAADAITAVPANTDGARRSYYTKKFFARSSEFFFKRPVIEARWEDTKKDDRGNFFYSSSLSTAEENLHTLFLYNYHRGVLRNIPNVTDNVVYVAFFSGSADNTAPSGSKLILVKDGTHVADDSKLYATGGLSSETGIYTRSVALTAAATPLTTIFDVWHGSYVISNENTLIQLATASFEPKKISLSLQNPSTQFVTNITNLKPSYSRSEVARFRVFTRQKDWNPTIYTKAVATTPPFIVESGSFSVARVIDGVQAIPFGTGSDLHTLMSFDVSGSYFDLDMSMLEPGYAYKVKFAYYNGSVGDWREQPQEFKFRVED